MTTNINERQIGGDGGNLDIAPVEVGEHSSASGEGAVALGVDAGAFADSSIAIGDGTTIDIEDAASIGPRDFFLTDGRKIVYPADQGSQTVADIPITDGASTGERHSLLFTVAGETTLELFAEADGVGGVQNLEVNMPGDLDVSGGVDAEELLATAIEIEDPDGNTYFAVDSDGATTALQLAGNNIDGLNKIDPSGGELLVDGDVTISGELTEGSAL